MYFKIKQIEFKGHTILIITVLITILHFVLTSIAAHLIAIQIGSRTGQLVAEGLIETTRSPKSSEKEVNEIHQDMTVRINDEISKWKIPLLLISLPIKPAIDPFLKKIRKAWIYDPVLSRKISKDEFEIRGKIINNIANGLNSTTFGSLIYLAFRLFMKE